MQHPTYRLHKSSGQAICTVRVEGKRMMLYLGAHNSVESRDQYALVCRAIDASTPLPNGAVVDRVKGRKAPLSRLSIAEICEQFLAHARVYYRHPDGSQTGEADNYRLAFRHLVDAKGRDSINSLTRAALREVRESMITSLSRKVINQRVGKIINMVRWAVDEVELCSDSILQSVSTLQPLKAGRSAARERKPIGPVDRSVVFNTLPHLSWPLQRMIAFLWHTGARPGEAARIRGTDIVDQSSDVWEYRPHRHKTTWRGKSRVVLVPRRGQSCIGNLLRLREPTEYLFRPIDMLYGAKRLRAGAFYSTRAIAHAVRKAAKRANLPHWHPNQLRHSFATRFRLHCGIESVSTLLGHSSISTTQLYAERDLESAKRILQKFA